MPNKKSWNVEAILDTMIAKDKMTWEEVVSVAGN
jgi:hypothetical protein